MHLPALFDEFWRIVDAGEYYDVPIPSARLNRMRARSMLLRSGTRVLQWAYRDIIERAAMSLAAETTASNIEDKGVAAYFRYVLRNREAADAARAYLRFLDQVAYHLYETSGRELPRVSPRAVSYKKFEAVVSCVNTQGSRRILSGGRDVKAAAREGFTDDGWKLLEGFRNVDTHRFVVGIDHMIQGFGPFEKGDPVRLGGRLIVFGDGTDQAYAAFAGPDLDFATVSFLLKACMRNSKGVLDALAKRRLLLRSEEF